ncbi:HPP family protein [Aureimonas phyllosphaerae]|uniref:CBS domain-containing membrane protein n=1 Tax=Aureimonas phyllosphaerae TaxID=1166078 RepID=A0A7W6FVN7_9HYPH|nr:HPP family protein [Aureimonas phyllosphaerae]MBB3937469.1 CBS domain-containing membrane protein [Aureimonas phyllosphaerae]MBB3961465.1 CBS domain-containing membrane protein [Aureimonas phyllosphaerae]SFF38426.1 CBS domain-containing membrane protein [Aureimonas phyllosphaerae]
MIALARRFLPDLPAVSWQERLRVVLGALLGLLVTGLVCRAAVGSGSALPILVAPMGASTVLLFAVPASPLAQPWSILGGNTIAALIGVGVRMLVPDPMLAAATAGAAAILAMLFLRCLHPPSGAVALTAVLGGPAVFDLGFGFALWPVAANSALLLLTALAYNNLTGRPYPHRAPRPAAGHATQDPPPSERIGFSTADLDAALAETDQLLDISRADLEALLRRTELHSFARRARATRAVDIMSRDVVAISPDASFREALDLLRRHHIKALPVTDDSARVVGILTQTDLLDKAAWDARGPRMGARERVVLTMRRGRAPAASVADIMTAPVTTIGPDDAIADVVPAMSALGIHHLPVTGPDGRLVGIVSQTDLVVALLADAARRGEPAD